MRRRDRKGIKTRLTRHEEIFASIRKISDDLLRKMQLPQAVDAMNQAFHATPKELGQAAVKNAVVSMYDPPAGWRYGFPKPYRPRLLDNGEIEPLEDTLRRDGYPQKEIDNAGAKYVRFWKHREE